jgi:hypothetical protein
MITDTEMDKVAALVIKTAPNTDWHKDIKKSGDSRVATIEGYKGEKLGEATVAFYKFVHPKPKEHEWDSVFIGFVIVVLKVGKKVIHHARSVVNKVQEHDWDASCLSHHFCPECKGLDTVKQKSGRRGREWVEIIYSCKCGYVDHDVMD